MEKERKPLLKRRIITQINKDHSPQLALYERQNTARIVEEHRREKRTEEMEWKTRKIRIIPKLHNECSEHSTE